jgi:hypothetical protein
VSGEQKGSGEQNSQKVGKLGAGNEVILPLQLTDGKGLNQNEHDLMGKFVNTGKQLTLDSGVSQGNADEILTACNLKCPINKELGLKVNVARVKDDGEYVLSKSTCEKPGEKQVPGKDKKMHGPCNVPNQLGKSKERKYGTYKRRGRSSNSSGEELNIEVGGKRPFYRDDLEIDVGNMTKKQKNGVVIPSTICDNVGLSKQPCENRRRLGLTTVGVWGMSRQLTVCWISRRRRTSTCFSCLKQKWMRRDWSGSGGSLGCQTCL